MMDSAANAANRKVRLCKESSTIAELVVLFVLFVLFLILTDNMASTRKKGHYRHDDTLDEFLLNQVAKFVKYGQLGHLSRDLRISQTDYEKITAPNYLLQNEQIFKVSTLLSVYS